MGEIEFIEKVGNINYIKVKGREYGIQDVSSDFASAIEESKILTKEQKLKKFISVIPSYETFKKLTEKNKGNIKTEIFHVDMMNYIYRPKETNFYLERILVEPKYWNAGIGSIIYSYIERFIKEMGYESIYIGAIGTWQIINFFKRQGFFPIDELDTEYIVPLLEELNNENIAVTDESGDRYIMPMHKYIGTGEIFEQFKTAIAPHLQYLKNQIAKDKDGRIMIKISDMTKAMGITASENSIYWGLKYVLFYEGIVVSTGQTKDKQSALLMRNKLESDVLPTYQT